MKSTSSFSAHGPLKQTSKTAAREVTHRGTWRWVMWGVLAFLLLFVSFAPPFVAYRAWAAVPQAFASQIEVRRGANVELQVQQPGRLIEDPIHKIIRWRLLFPTIGNVIRFPAGFVLALSHLGCLVAVVYCAILYAKNSAAPQGLNAAAFAVLLGGCSWFMTSMTWLGYFDAWLALAFLVVAFSPNWWAIAAASLLAPWIDERFVLGLPMCLLVRFVRSDVPLRSLFVWALREAALPVGLVVAYLAVRLNLQNVSGTNTVGGYFSEVSFLKIAWTRHLFGMWEGLRIAWLPLLLGIFLLFRHQRVTNGVLLLLGVAATALMGLATANDLSRSMILLVPAAALGVFVVESWAPPWARIWLPCLAVATLILPANHVVSDFTKPIRGLWEEARRLSEPPMELNAAYYLELARLRIAEQNLNDARSYATVAVRLSPADPTLAHSAALVFYKVGDVASTVAALDAALRAAPERPDIRLSRAEVHAAAERWDAARSDVDVVLRSPSIDASLAERASALSSRINEALAR